MTAISNNNIARAIYSVTKDKSVAEQSAIVPQVVKFLARKRLLSKSPDILARLNKIINEDMGKIVAKISSVEKISETTRKEISQSLSKRYGGKEITLEENLDERVLGGYKIEVNDEVIDLTIKNRMKKLQAHLTA
jgi:F-type H+-transporting ATPase subunit delta